MTVIPDKELGFGKIEGRQRRLLTPDGKYNYVRHGLPFRERFHIYQYLIQIRRHKFLAFVLLWYLCVNMLFTALYYCIGVEHLTGMIFQNPTEQFLEVFFFSSQTLTTVGYGRINPSGWAAGLVAALESLFGLLSFALVTGLLYGRFSKPTPRIRFSKNALIAPYQNGMAFMFRIVNILDSNLLDVRAQIGLSMIQNNRRKFYSLLLERDSLMFFPASWTIVHPIDAESPLLGLDETTLQTADPEFLILIQGFDDTFYQTIHVKKSYKMSEMIYGAKFLKINNLDENGLPTVDINKLDSVEKYHVE